MAGLLYKRVLRGQKGAGNFGNSSASAFLPLPENCTELMIKGRMMMRSNLLES
jgi:hypothetical protein